MKTLYVIQCQVDRNADPNDPSIWLDYSGFIRISCYYNNLEDAKAYLTNWLTEKKFNARYYRIIKRVIAEEFICNGQDIS